MGKQRDREEFVAIMAKEGVPVDVARSLMRASASLTRIAELQCSSEAADRDRVPCPGYYGTPPSCLCREYGSGLIDGTEHGTVPRINVQEAAALRRRDRVRAPLRGRPLRGQRRRARDPHVSVSPALGAARDRGEEGCDAL